MFDTDAIKRAFGKAATDYAAHAELQHAVREDAIRLGESCWKTGAKILDAGSGPGGFSHSAKLLGLGWNITQLDIAFGMCKAAGSAVNADLAALPFADASFDGIFSSLALQWVGDPLLALREMARVTKRGGRIVISTFVHGTLEELRASFASLDNHPHVSPFANVGGLSLLAAHAGFFVLSTQEEIFLAHYPDVRMLMKNLKAIGAGNKLSGRVRGLMTPRKLAALEEHYHKQFGTRKGLPATWQVLWMVLEKRP